MRAARPEPLFPTCLTWARPQTLAPSPSPRFHATAASTPTAYARPQSPA
ncbi:hypothetical protein HMPREF0043_01464 [Actinobaculum sp. oral taxon 183 str. F0552]|nr:hypothetical protein HMPREF0043_01464 [Actinobaculum sp. oral taxon 183 str. F0552]